MKVAELYRILDRKFPPTLSCDWDNDGLMCCPDPGREVKNILLTLDVTEEAASLAERGNFDVILSHHPLIFHPLHAVVSPKLTGLIQNGISVMSFHTRLDKAEGGVNTVLAELLGLRDARPFSEEGIGRMGELREMQEADAFLSFVKKTLSCPFVEAVFSGRPCRRVAVVGGDGKDLLDDAIAAGCDTYLTGSMSYNSMTDAAEKGVTVIAAGHYYTENPVLPRLAALIKALDGGISCWIFDCNLIKTLV